MSTLNSSNQSHNSCRAPGLTIDSQFQDQIRSLEALAFPFSLMQFTTLGGIGGRGNREEQREDEDILEGVYEHPNLFVLDPTEIKNNIGEFKKTSFLFANMIS